MIVFIPLCSKKDNDGDWAISCADYLPRECPHCCEPSIVGHGRRRKQAHDEKHDWICIRRGICNHCGTTFTFLPIFSLPYCHYSLIARSQAAWTYFVENCSLDMSAPLIKDPDRIAAPSTLRRWFHSLDSSILCEYIVQLPSKGESKPSAGSEPIAIRQRKPFPFLQKIFEVICWRLACGEILNAGPLILSRRNLVPFLHILWHPLRC
jgi:hypothetical protein